MIRRLDRIYSSRRRRGRRTPSLPIVGYKRLSLVDFPRRLCATAYIAGCNFRCPHCTNVEIVLNYLGMKQIPEMKVLNHLHRVKGFLSGLCLSGGEPTLHNGLLPFAYKVKSLGYNLKIDTNGSKPRRLKKLIDDKLVDYITLDVKAPLNLYKEVVRSKIDVKDIKESIRLLRRRRIDHEFRTTMVPGLIDGNSLEMIANTLIGSKRFVIQQFRPCKTICPKFSNIEPYSIEDLKRFREKVKPYFAECIIRI